MKRISLILAETCGLTEEAHNEALKIQEERGGRIGEILIQQKAITEADLLRALSIQFGLEYRDSLPTEDLDTGFAEHVPIQFLKKYKMVPVITPESRFIAAHNPLLFQPLDDLRLLLDLEGIESVFAPHSAILSLINYAYDTSSRSAEQVIQDMHEEDSELIISEIEQTGDLHVVQRRHRRQGAQAARRRRRRPLAGRRGIAQIHARVPQPQAGDVQLAQDQARQTDLQLQ